MNFLQARWKVRVGKNSQGWYVAIPRFWGSFDVLEGIPDHARAMELANQYLGSTQ